MLTDKQVEEFLREHERIKATSIGTPIYKNNRFAGYHAGGGGLMGGWECSSGHMVPAAHSGCPTCSGNK